MTKAVIDTSTWISLARAGLLPLLGKIPLDPVLTDVVQQEAVVDGLAGGHGDAAAIRDAVPGPVARWWPTTWRWAAERGPWECVGCGPPI